MEVKGIEFHIILFTHALWIQVPVIIGSYYMDKNPWLNYINLGHKYSHLVTIVIIHSKHETFAQCWLDVEPTSYAFFEEDLDITIHYVPPEIVLQQCIKINYKF